MDPMERALGRELDRGAISAALPIWEGGLGHALVLTGDL